MSAPPTSASETPRILVVDDDAEIRGILCEFLALEGFITQSASSGPLALEQAPNFDPSLILLDVFMPGMDGLELLAELRRRGLNAPVIVITGSGTMETAIKAIRAGAYEYVVKPFDFAALRILLRRCLEETGGVSRGLPKTSTQQRLRYDLIGGSHAMIEVYKSIGLIAATPLATNILILGESGTGKELIAHQIHQWSANSAGPFIALNMTALPENLIESELFGYEKGAFTGAAKSRKGKFEDAATGTLFLDEIGSISHAMQLKLLRVLQEREYYRLAGYETIPVRCRVIAATNEDLELKVKEKLFRQDLYYRLKVLTIRVPPLRERIEDVPRLVEYFSQKHSAEFGRSLPVIPQDTLEFLCSYSWPGNVRELENAIAHALVVSRTDSLRPRDFSELKAAVSETPHFAAQHLPLDEARRLQTDSFERQYVTSSLSRSGGNVTSAARDAGVSRQRFYQLMQKYDITAETFKTNA